MSLRKREEESEKAELWEDRNGWKCSLLDGPHKPGNVERKRRKKKGLLF
jgi:hypothetical protein